MATLTQPSPIAVVAAPPFAPAGQAVPRDEPGPAFYRLSLDQYHAMARAGILTSADRVELLEGLLVTKMTKNSPHIVASGVMNEFLMGAPPAGWCVIPETPIVLEEAAGNVGGNAPEPDFALLRGRPADYADRRPGPRDAALVVEIADSSLSMDRLTKKAIYAKAAIPAYWIVNIPGRRVEVYTEPTGPEALPDYRVSRFYGPGEEVPLTIDGVEVGRIAVRDLIPHPPPGA